MKTRKIDTAKLSTVLEKIAKKNPETKIVAKDLGQRLHGNDSALRGPFAGEPRVKYVFRVCAEAGYCA